MLLDNSAVVDMFVEQLQNFSAWKVWAVTLTFLQGPSESAVTFSLKHDKIEGIISKKYI